MDNEKAVNEQLTGTSTADLIAELSKRKLSEADVTTLKSFKPEESASTLATASVTETKDTGLPNVDRFVSAIVKKNFQGKLPSGTIIDGMAISLAGGFYDHGPNQDMKFTPLEDAVYKLHNKIYPEQDKMPGLMQSEIVTVSPSTTNPENKVITFFFFQDRKQIDGRGWCTPAHAQMELPASTASELVVNVSSDPDMLEAFYQGAFKGLDSKGEGLPGVRRIKATGFYLLTPVDLDKASVAGSSYDKSKINDVFKDKTRYEFKNGPYGSGDVFQLR